MLAIYRYMRIYYTHSDHLEYSAPNSSDSIRSGSLTHIDFSLTAIRPHPGVCPGLRIAAAYPYLQTACSNLDSVISEQ
jgi:hypothetical protein